jgi:CheY-like chemotaxis protein
MDANSQSNIREDDEAKSEQMARLEEEIAHCREELCLKTLRLNEFLAHLNQKLRTPLNAITGFAELLEMQCDDASMADNITQILKGARGLLAIINREFAELKHGNVTSNVAGTLHCNVLYIEDDPANFALVQRILEERPAVRLLQAIRGEIGLALAETHDPKLILLDLNLPDMHGSELLQRVRQNAATTHIPVVVISADATASQIERLLSAGARNYLTKPFSIEPFLAVVDEILEETDRRISNCSDRTTSQAVQTCEPSA